MNLGAAIVMEGISSFVQSDINAITDLMCLAYSDRSLNLLCPC